MIFVTLGTHPQPFDRLLAELERLILSDQIHDDVIVQAARFGYQPRRLSMKSVLPYAEMLALIASADVVITHAGPATLAAARAAGRHVVVVPRSSAFGEHVDDHQVRYARRLVGREGYEIVEDMDDLLGAIDRARSTRVVPTSRDARAAVTALERLVLAAGKRTKT